MNNVKWRNSSNFKIISMVFYTSIAVANSNVAVNEWEKVNSVRLKHGIIKIGMLESELDKIAVYPRKASPFRPWVVGHDYPSAWRQILWCNVGGIEFKVEINTWDGRHSRIINIWIPVAKK